VASTSRPGLGIEVLHDFADLQRQVGERVAPLQTRQHLRRRRLRRRRTVRTVSVLLPLLVVVLLAVNAADSRTWIGQRWSDLSRTTSGQSGQPAHG
jgi:hypothetical protein